MKKSPISEYSTVNLAAVFERVSDTGRQWRFWKKICDTLSM